jgi:SAM-dependent methyltransferase
MTDADDARRFAPATLRNREPILDVLRQILPASGLVLELASGSGEHGVYFAHHLPDLDWQPSDPSLAARQSIAAWAQAEGLTNLRDPLDLDAAQAAWPIDRADAIACINMVHISPWEATLGLMRGAGRVLPVGGVLYLYGPYRRGARPLEPGNAAFDQDLRARDARWGLREVEDVVACAHAHGLAFERAIEMPANNLSLIFSKA